jgi:opacity protein-like surface antigen
MLRKSFAAIAAITLLAGSSAAAAQSAQPLSLGNAPGMERAGASVAGTDELGSRGYGVYIIGAIILGAIIWGIIELTSDDEGSSSP